MALLTESVTHPERAQKAADLQQAYCRWESNLKEFQRGRPTGLDDDVKANAMRHMMPKEILDAVNLKPQYRTFVEIRDYTWQKARQQADVFVRDVSLTTETCHHSITCEHEHEQSHFHEGHSSGPNGCVSNEFECLGILNGTT